MTHPLIAEIERCRAEMTELEARKRRDRESEMRLSIYTNGLIKAAILCGFTNVEEI